jgi:hypothetical protein
MRVALAMPVIALLSACADAGEGDRRDFSGEASRAAEQQARDRCAAEGKRAQLRNVFENVDGSRRYEYQCIQ